jgi:hypothetical protein
MGFKKINSKVKYGVHPMANQMNSVQILTVYSFKTHFNNILSHLVMSPKWLLTVGLPICELIPLLSYQPT